MTLGERLVLYVIQGIRDEGGFPSRTKLLKIIYLIDVEYFRRHRRTLTGWEWFFYYFGPYVFDYPNILESLGVSFLDETKDTTPAGKTFYGYEVHEDQEIDDLVSLADRVMIDEVVRRWSLEDLNSLLNHAYFETEPMMDAERGQPLDFGRIPRQMPVPDIEVPSLVIPEESREYLRARLAEARDKYEERAARTASLLAAHPLRPDSSYRDSMERRDRAEATSFPENVRIIVGPD